jgi:hypothetical protein
MKFLTSIILALELSIAPVFASGTLTLVGAGAGTNGAAIPATITLANSAASCASASVCTLTNSAISTASSTRFVIVAIQAIVSTRTITSVTIGGVSASSLYDVNGTNTKTAYYGLLVPTGTTATIIVNWSGALGANGGAIGVYAAYDLLSTTPIDSQNSTASPGVINMTTQSGGVAIMGGSIFGTSPTDVITGGITRQYDLTNVATASRFFGGGIATSGASISSTGTYVAAGSGTLISGVAFR